MAVSSNDLRVILRFQSDLAQKIGKDDAALKAVASSLNGLSGPARSMSASLAGVGHSADTATKQLQNLSKESAGVGNSLKQGLAMGAGFGLVTAGLQLAGKAFQATKSTIIDFNAQLQGAEAAFTGLLGSGTKARAFLGDLQKFAACVDVETEAFTREGWQAYHELGPGTEILTINQATGLAEWQPIQEMYVYEGEHPVLRMQGQHHDSISTLNHSWPIYPRGLHNGRILMATSETLAEGDQLIGAATLATYPDEPTYSDAFVELVAWFWTEGCVHPPSGDIDAPGARVTIRQSERANPEKVARIDVAFRHEFGEPGPGTWGRTIPDRDGGVTFRLAREPARRLLAVAPGKLVSLDFFYALTREQLDLFIAVSLLGDGHVRPRTGQMTLTQRRSDQAERFADAVTLSGRRARVFEAEHGRRWVVSVYRQTPRIGLSHARRSPTQMTRDVLSGIVWCPRVRNGTWYARRNGHRYFTGNTTPFEFPDVLKASQRFLGMGVAAERVIPILTDIGKVTAAFGGTSETINRVSVALSQMGARGRVSAQDMNQLTEAGIPAWSLLAKAIGLPIAKVRELSEQGQISADVMFDALHQFAETEEITKAAEQVGKQWNAASSNALDGMRMLISAGTRPLFEELTKVVAGVGDWLTKSADAKTTQMALAVSVQALMQTFGPLVTGIGQAGRALLELGAALPIFDRLKAAFAAIGKGGQGSGPAEDMAAGLEQASVQSAQVQSELAAINTELTAMPKQAAAVADQLQASEASLRNNAVAIKAVAGGLREVKADAEAVTTEYGRQADAVKAQIGGIESAQAAVKDQVDATKAAYDRQTDALKTQQRVIEQQQSAVKRQIEDTKSAFDDMAAPIEAALRETTASLRDNKTAADEVKRSYAAQIDPLERALDTIKGQIDLQRQQEDLAFRIRDAELARAKVAAIGDPIERAKVAAQLDALDAQKDSLELEKRAADIRKRLKDDKDVSPQEREILRIDQERIALQQRLAGMTDQQALAEIKIAQAALDSAKDQQDIVRAQEDMALTQHKQVIDGLKAEERARLDVLGKQRTELERQADDQKAMLDALKVSLEAALAPLEARSQALARQHEDIANSIKAVEDAERRALAPLEARGKELDRQKAALQGQAKAIKDAEEAALAPIQARQRELEKTRDALQDERDALGEIKVGLQEANAEAEKHAATLQSIKQELENPPRVPDTTGLAAGEADAKAMAASVREISLSLQELGSFITPVLVGLAAYKVATIVAAIATGGLAVVLGTVSLPLIAIGVALGVLALAWSRDWGGIQSKTQAFVDWLTGTAIPGIQAFFTWLQRDAMLRFAFEWQTFWAERVVDVQKALIAFLKAAQDGWKAFTDWWDGGSPLFEALWRTFWNTTIPAPFKALWAGLTGTAQPGWEQFIGWLTGALAAFVKLWTDTWEKLPKPNIPWPFGQAPGGAGTSFTSMRGGPGSWNNLVPGGRGEPTSGGTHGGSPAVDIFAPSGTPIRAPVGGTSSPGVYPLGGNATVIAGDDGNYYYFAHGAVPFTPGRVEAGQQIGQVGNTGNAANTPPHLHFAAATDPSLFSSLNGSGNIDPRIVQQAVTQGFTDAAPLVQRAFQYAIQAGLPDPELFAAQIQQESGFDPNALSSAGARGIAQFMPGTAAAVAAQMGVSLEEFWSSVDLQLQGAAMHMADLTKQFGSQERALSAYFAGPGGGVHPDYVRAVEAQRAAVRGPARAGMAGGMGSFTDEVQRALAESFHIRPEIFDSMGAQVANFAQLMTENLDPAAISAQDALMRLSNAMTPVENAVANTVMPLGDLERTLVEMVARAGFGDEAFKEMTDGSITSFTALKQTAAMLASIDPRFQTLLDNLNETGASSADFALDLLNLLKTLNSPAAQEALTPPAEGVAPSVKAPPTVVIDPNVTKNLDATKAGVVAVSTTTIEQNRVMMENWKTVGLAIDEARDRLRVYTDYLFELTPQRLQEQTGGWQEIAKWAETAGRMARDYNAAVEDLEPPPTGDDIPEAHTGARVTAGGVAELEAGEVVLTPEQQERYGLGGGGPVYNITNNLTVNPRPGDEYRVYENFRVMSALWGSS
jgi:tape measure domain-containing protein